MKTLDIPQALQEEILAQYAEVERSLERLAQRILDPQERIALHVHAGSEGIAPRAQVAEAIQKLDYAEAPDLNAVHVLQGAVGCGLELIELVKASNQAKDALMASIQKLEGDSAESRRRLLRSMLSQQGLQGISLKHVYRHIHVLEETPRKLSYLVSQNSMHRKISFLEAEERLLKSKHRGPHIDIQIQKLRTLDPKTQQLILYRPIHKSYSVNVFTEAGITKFPTSLPVFYVQEPQKEAPIIQFSEFDEASRSKRKGRSDKRVSEEVFLPSIGAFLILKQYF